MLLTTALTSGQITFVLRIIIQALSYGGVFLIGLIILGNSPRSASKETHDVLNRVVGQSTATSRTLKWMRRQISTKDGDPIPSKPLLFALVLSMLYGLLASLSDVGFLGLNECTVPYPTFHTSPASIQTEADARVLVEKSIINGTDPKLVQVHQCDSASDVVLGVNTTQRICSQWHNTTYDDPTLFRSLNLTDSDTLMYKNLGRINITRPNGFDLNNFFLGASDHVVMEPTIRNGLAVLPHKTGVKLVVGAPTLSKNQVVNIPKTMGVEIEVGCLSVGVFGEQDASSGNGRDWFMPDPLYKSNLRSRFSGPEYLFAPLEKAADAARALIRPGFNTSIVDNSGLLRSFNRSSFLLSWQTQLNSWFPSNGTSSDSDTRLAILSDCASDVHKAANVSIPPDTVKRLPQACGFYQLSGSWADMGIIFQGATPLVCASATAINMVSANLEMDNDGRISSQLTRLPSDLNIVLANYYDIAENRDNDTVLTNFDIIQRYTLSDNPHGDLQHYVYQQYPTTLGALFQGTGSPGYAISQVGAAMVAAGGSRSNPTVLVVNSTFFSFTDTVSSTVKTVTEWAGAFGASYFLATFAMNGYAALDKPRLTIRSTGGRPAVCYQTPYVAGFLPLILAALIVMLWSLHMLVSSKLRDTKKWEGLYGGLVPATVHDTHPQNEMLVWDETDTQPHLRPLKHAYGDDDSEKATMMPSPHTL